ncbi:Neurochondrin-domain-containing protein [Pilobolus umbonatus]|nr:Neurochondrin-domain-containing protein [Pilobolus umbonatus]
MSTVGSSERDRTAEIDRCLTLIQPSASDESKFVGMLMLPRLLDQKNTQSVERVFKGMNFKFIERLLRTQTSNSEVPEPVLKEIAVNILSCFARFESMADDQNMVDKIPALSRIVQPNDTTEVTKEVIHILLCVAVKKEGLVKMLDPDVIKNIFHVLMETESKEERDLCSDLIQSVYARSCHLLNSAEIPSLSSTLKYSLNTLFHLLSAILCDDQKALKFTSLDLLYSIVPNIPIKTIQAFKKESEKSLEKWLSNIQDGLRQLLTSKLNDAQRDKAIGLTAYLLRYFGNDWFFGSLEETKAMRRKRDKSGTGQLNKEFAKVNFPALFIHLVTIETKVMLDDVEDRMMREHNEGKTIVEVTKKPRQDKMIPLYFEIIEAAMEYLGTHYVEDRESGMDPEMLLKIRTALSDTMDVVIELVKFMQSISDRPSDLDDNLVIQACIRILALWMAEEGLEMPEEKIKEVS